MSEETNEKRKTETRWAPYRRAGADKPDPLTLANDMLNNKHTLEKPKPHGGKRSHKKKRGTIYIKKPVNEKPELTFQLDYKEKMAKDDGLVDFFVGGVYITTWTYKYDVDSCFNEFKKIFNAGYDAGRKK